MQRDEALRRIAEIQRIAERTTLYTMLPGWQAIIGGLLALAACAVSWLMLRSFDFRDMKQMSDEEQTLLCALWVLIAAVAVVQDVVLTVRVARKQGIEPVGRPGRFALLSLSPSILVALLLTAKFLLDFEFSYIAPVWMMCYGTGVYAAGLFSMHMVRVLGLGFVVVGALALQFPQVAVLMAALSFGLLHIAFGAAVLWKAQRDGNR